LANCKKTEARTCTFISYETQEKKIAGETQTCIPESIVAIATSAASLIVLKLHVAT